MKFEVGDKVVFGEDYRDPGIIESINEDKIAVRWNKAGLLTYSETFWGRIKIVEKNKSEFKTVQVVKLEDYTGTIVEFKGRKYKLSLVE